MRSHFYIMIAFIIVACSKYQGDNNPIDSGRCSGTEIGNGIDFSGKDLSDCDFSNQTLLQANFTNAILDRTNFKKADLKRAMFSNTTGIETDFNEAILDGSQFENGIWKKVNFSKSKLADTQWINNILDGVDFQKSTGNNVHFVEGTINRSHFGDSTLSFSSFSNLLIQQTYFSHTSKESGLSQISFQNSELIQVSFAGASLSGVTFIDLPLFSQINFSGAQIRASQFQTVAGNNLKFDQTKVEQTSFDKSTVLGPSSDLVFISEIPEDQMPFPDPGKILNTSFTLSEFDELRITESDLSGSIWEKVKGRLYVVASIFNGALLNDSDLKKSTFSENSSLNGAIFTQGDLSGSHFIASTVSNLTFNGTNLSGTRFSSVVAEVEGVHFNEANLDGINFHQSTVPNSSFQNIQNLKGQFYSTNFSGSRFENLADTVLNLFNVDLSNSIITNTQMLFDVLQKTNFDGVKTEAFSLNNTRTWEQNQFELMVSNGNQFHKAILKGSIADFFYDWLMGVPNCTNSNRPIQKLIPFFHPQGANAPWGFDESIMSQVSIDNLVDLEFHSTCGNYRCTKSGNDLLCGKIP